MADKKIPVRVLFAVTILGVEYPPNTALELDAKMAKSLKDSGLVDDHKDSVAYALTLGELVSPELPADPAGEQIKPLDDAGGDDKDKSAAT